MENLDLKIYNAIKAEANNYFNEIAAILDAGTYTPAQITNILSDQLRTEINGKIHNPLNYIEGKNVHYNRSYNIRKYASQPFIKSVSTGYDEHRRDITTVCAYNSGKQINIEVDTFKLTFDACKVFDYLEKFAKYLKIKDNPTFTKTDEQTEQPEAQISFDIEITKEHQHLCKYVANDEQRPILNNIFLSLEYHTLVASNGYVMGEKPARITNLRGEQPEQSPRNIFINPQHLKKCVGHCKVEYFRDRTEIINSKGERFTTLGKEPFYQYKNVIPTVINHKIEPVNSDEIKTFLKACIKNKNGRPAFVIKGNKGENKLQIIHSEYDNEIENTFCIDLNNQLEISFTIGYSLEQFLKLEKFETMYISNYDKATIFDSKNGYILLMAFMVEDAFVESVLEYIEHPFLTSSYKPAEIAPEQVLPEPIKAKKETSIEYIGAEIAEQLISEHIEQTNQIKEVQQTIICKPTTAKSEATKPEYQSEQKQAENSPKTADNPVQKTSVTRLFRTRKRKISLQHYQVQKTPEKGLKIAGKDIQKTDMKRTTFSIKKTVLNNNNSPPVVQYEFYNLIICLLKIKTKNYE